MPGTSAKNYAECAHLLAGVKEPCRLGAKQGFLHDSSTTFKQHLEILHSKCNISVQSVSNFCLSLILNLMFLVDEKNAENGRKGCQCKVNGIIQLQKCVGNNLTNEHDDLLPSSIAEKSWMEQGVARGGFLMWVAGHTCSRS